MLLYFMNYKIKGKKCSEWTIPELKNHLSRRKEKVSGKKQDLCDRLRDSLKRPIDKTKIQSRNKTTSKKPASVKLLPINIQNPLFVFYSTLYYQKPNSKMALEELGKYGLTKNILNKHKSYQSLWKYLT